MNRLKVFLASSSELRADRDRFRLYISELNDRLTKNDIYIEVVVWETFLDHVSKGGLQKSYNEAVQDCHIFVMLYFTKVGPYTAQEFSAAFGAFKEGGLPLIYTFFKDAPIQMGAIDERDFASLTAFQRKLKTLKHYQKVYSTPEDLLFQFDSQLDRLLDSDLFRHRRDHGQVSKPASRSRASVAKEKAAIPKVAASKTTAAKEAAPKTTPPKPVAPKVVASKTASPKVAPPKTAAPKTATTKAATPRTSPAKAAPKAPAAASKSAKSTASAAKPAAKKVEKSTNMVEKMASGVMKLFSSDKEAKPAAKATKPKAAAKKPVAKRK